MRRYQPTTTLSIIGLYWAQQLPQTRDWEVLDTALHVAVAIAAVQLVALGGLRVKVWFQGLVEFRPAQLIIGRGVREEPPAEESLNE